MEEIRFYVYDQVDQIYLDGEGSPGSGTCDEISERAVKVIRQSFAWTIDKE